MPCALLAVLAVATVAFLPAIEVRGAIPLAYALLGRCGSLLWVAIAVAVASNALVAPVALHILSKIESWLLRKDGRVWGRLKNAYLGVAERALRRKDTIEKWGAVGLALFVAIPLPGSGAWTGALIAHVLRMGRGNALTSIITGVAVASITVTLAVEGVVNLASIPLG